MSGAVQQVLSAFLSALRSIITSVGQANASLTRLSHILRSQASGSSSPNEAIAAATIGKGKTHGPVADATDQLVNAVLQQNGTRVFGSDIAVLQPSTGTLSGSAASASGEGLQVNCSGNMWRLPEARVQKQYVRAGCMECSCNEAAASQCPPRG